MIKETYIVKITSQAREELHEITHYITHELKAPDAALHLLDALENAFLSLANFPQRIPLIDIEPWRTNGIRHLLVKNFLIYFWIDEINKKVQITAVIYKKRNQLQQLSKMNME